MKPARFAARVRGWTFIVIALAFGILLYEAFANASYGLLPLHFNVWAIASIITVAINITLFVFLVTRPARTEERNWLAFFILCLAMYAVSEVMQRLTVNATGALFWSNAATVSAGASPAVLLFTLAYTNQSEKRYPGIASILLVATLAIVFFYNFTNIIFINDASKMIMLPWGWDSRNTLGPAVIVSPIWYDLLLAGAMARLISFRRHTRNAVLRRQSLLFIFAISLPLIVGTMTDVIIPSVAPSFVIPPLTTVFSTLAACIIVFGLIRYQLLTVSPTLFSNTVLAIMQEAVVATDKDFNIIFANERAEEFLGVKLASNQKMQLLDAVTHQSQATFQKMFETVPAEGKTVSIEHIDVQHGHSEPTPVRVTATQLKLSGFDAWVVVLTDISKELQTQRIIEHEVMVRTEELHRAQTYLLSSINSLEQGFILVDRNSKVELANGVAAKLFGVTASAASEKHLVELAKGMQWNIDLADMVHKVLDSKRHRMHEAETADGSFYQIYVTPIISGDRELGATVVIQNITEQKILDRSKDEFFSIASHELRTPLTAIRGNMSMVKDYFPEAMKDESLASMITDTHNASVRLIEIVSDFLDSSKLEQGKMEFDIKPVEVKPLVEAVQGDLKTLLAKSKDTLETKGLDKLPKVAADEGRLRQIFYNLLSNAMKYSENATITVSGDAADGKVRIHITDTGKGISPENQKLLFHKFQQAGDMLTRDDTKGTGLGLYISRLLAENMGGSVELERTEVGKGSTFVVILPEAAQA